MKKISYLLIVFIAVTLYFPVFYAGYVWDDNLLFVDKVKLLNEPLSWSLLTEPVLPNTTYFRPLIFLTIYTEFYLFGQNPLSSHIINLIIIIINAYLVSLIAYQLLKIKNNRSAFWLSLLAGIIYIVNPVLVEATAWISGRFDLLVTTFTLSALYYFIKIKSNTWKNSIVISILFFLALLSKELGIILPILIFFMYMYLNVNPEKKYIKNIEDFFYEYYKLIICLIFSFFIYFILRLQAMGDIYHETLDKNYIQEIYLENYLPIHSLFFYIKQFIVPFNELTPLLPFDHLNDHKINILLKSIVILTTIIGIAWALIKKNQHIWLILSALFSIFLVIYLIPLTIANNIAHNRFMTLGVAFISILIVILPYEKLRLSLQRSIIAIVTLWILIAALTTKSIVPFWQSDFSLWKWTYTVQPDNALARNSYIYGLYQARKFEEVLNVIDDYKAKSDSGLTVPDQIMYVNTLISMDNPEALKYAEGVYIALPKLHQMYKNKSEYRFSAMSNSQIAAFYGTYALAIAVFELNPNKALSINSIAYWYLNDDEKLTYLYNEVAYLYLAGEHKKAKELYHNLQTLKSYSTKRYYYNMVNIVDKVCLQKNKNSCLLQRDKFLKILE